jgi:membrane associated rhomboid family serine protease
MYNRGALQGGWQKFSGGSTPFTWTVIGASIVTFFLIAGVPNLPLLSWGVFRAEQWWLRPWTLLTWPLLAAESPLSLLFSIGWMYLFGGSMERAWGTSLYARFFALTAVLSALTYGLGALLVGATPMAMLLGLWPAMGATMVAWALLNKHETISFFLMPLPAWAIGLLGIALAWYHAGGALLGLFALSGCGAAYWYVLKGRNLRTSKKKPTDNVRFVNFGQELREETNSKNPFTRAAEEKKKRERDKKLEEMFRRSGYDDDGNRS